MSRLVAAVLAVGITAAGVITVIEVVAAATGHRQVVLGYQSAYRYGLHNTWHATSVRVILVTAGVIGLVLLAIAFGRQPPLVLALAGEASDETEVTRRSSLEQALGRAAAGVDGIARAKARLRRRRITVSADANRRDTAGLKDAVRAEVETVVNRVGLAARPPVSVHVTRKRS